MHSLSTHVASKHGASPLIGAGLVMLTGKRPNVREACSLFAAGTLFAIGILNAGFMGIVVVSLSTAYAFSEFFGLSGSLDTSYNQSRTFYIIFLGQLLVAAVVNLFPGISLFQLVITTQAINAMVLPLVFFYLIRLTSNKGLMKEYANSKFQRYFSIAGTVIIVTHDLGEAFALADRVGVLDDGELVACANAAVVARSTDPRVRQLLDALPQVPR